ncbi:MAG: CPBP family intramembrane metalloprotease [Cellulosilyticum sp.]|nr:CPBP family intramembrane metalloprotease [Cellulosilyticum sp.]
MNGMLATSNAQLITDKKQMQKEVGRLGIGGLMAELIMFICIVVEIIIETVRLMKAHNWELPDAEYDQLIEQMMMGGKAYIIAVILITAILAVWLRKLNYGHLFSTHREMKVKTFAMCFSVMMGFQLIFSIVASGVEAILNPLGYTMMSDIESASDMSSTISMFLYASFIGPIAEEIIFRGFALKGLEKYGKRFAITISAILFGLYHGNLIQSLLAIGTGLVLGYVAEEYSIKWAILMHVINNFIFSDVLGYLIKDLSEGTQDAIILGMEIIFFVLAVMILLLKRKSIINYCKEEQAMPIRYAFGSFGMIIFTAVMMFIAFSGIEKLVA